MRTRCSIDFTDWNADGRPDLIVSNYNNDRLRILQNNGNGTFSALINYNPGGNPIAAVVGEPRVWASASTCARRSA